MLKKYMIILALSSTLVACSSSSDMPQVVQASVNMPQVTLTQGMATQIEVPTSRRVQSVTVGNPGMVTADHVDNVINLVPKEGAGQTNLIVRAVNDDGETKIYQYRVIVQAP